MIQVTYRELLEAGAHFGHRVSRWNPSMRPYIFGKRNGIHIIDIRETLKGLIRAAHAMTTLAANGGEVVFVGTKRQARDLVLQESQRCSMPYVVDRWIGGTLTNFETIKSRVRRLDELDVIEREAPAQRMSKKDLARVVREKRKMLRNLQGIRTMKQMPAAILIIDPGREANCVREAKRLGVVTIGYLDSDCDPSSVDFPVPGNDDAMKSIAIFLRVMADAALEGRRLTARTGDEETAEVARAAAE